MLDYAILGGLTYASDKALKIWIIPLPQMRFGFIYMSPTGAQKSLFSSINSLVQSQKIVYSVLFHNNKVSVLYFLRHTECNSCIKRVLCSSLEYYRKVKGTHGFKKVGSHIIQLALQWIFKILVQEWVYNHLLISLQWIIFSRAI